jgi:hypothetical protein
VGGLPEPPATLEPPRRDYEACFDATLENGFLTYAECYLAGETEEEVLISTHACHPSLANDNLSGVVVARSWPSIWCPLSAVTPIDPVRPGDDRINHVARSERGSHVADQARLGPRESRRPGEVDV